MTLGSVSPRKRTRGLAALVLIAVSSVALGACAGGPDHRPAKRGGDKPVAAYAGHAFKPVALLLGAMDANGDHRVDGAELDAGIDREWENLATAQPVRRLDFQRWATSALGAVDSPPTFAAFDGNTDDILTPDEFESRLREEFASLDANADGVLERAELTFQVQAPPAGDRRPPRR